MATKIKVCIPEGTTTRFRAELVDKNDNPIDLSTLDGYLVTLYYEDRKILEKYSKNPITGFNTDDLHEEDIPGGLVDVIIQRSTTIGKKHGDIYCEVHLQDNDALADDDRWKSIANDYAFTLVESVSGNVPNLL